MHDTLSKPPSPVITVSPGRCYRGLEASAVPCGAVDRARVDEVGRRAREEDEINAPKQVTELITYTEPKCSKAKRKRSYGGGRSKPVYAHTGESWPSVTAAVLLLGTKRTLLDWALEDPVNRNCLGRRVSHTPFEVEKLAG